jgi:cytochrome c-type biogenesis protein CcmH
MRYFIQFALLLLLIQGAFAESIEVKDFENSSQESRYLDLIDNIRCPVCQGQSIGGSNSGLAKDLREQVRKMILNDKSDDDIYLFMIERYGDFVIFKPPINWKTYLLWFTPLIFLVLCFIYLIRIISKKRDFSVKSSAEIERAKNLLK